MGVEFRWWFELDYIIKNLLTELGIFFKNIVESPVDFKALDGPGALEVGHAFGLFCLR